MERFWLYSCGEAQKLMFVFCQHGSDYSVAVKLVKYLFQQIKRRLFNKFVV